MNEGEIIRLATSQASSAAASLAPMLVDKAKEKFVSFVVDRWTRHRANAFFEAFLSALEKECNSAKELREVDELLNQILSNEANSEVLFDAYRRVCFSKSKEIGPKIIGILTGAIVLQKRMSTVHEDRVFLAAETLSDSDLYSFFKRYREKLELILKPRRDDSPYMSGDDLVVPWYEESRDTTFEADKALDLSPLNMNEALGPWGKQLELLGIVRYKMTTRQIGQANTTSIYSYSIIFDPSATLLSDLFERAIGAATSGDPTTVRMSFKNEQRP